jgi:hypothetical protein
VRLAGVIWVADHAGCADIVVEIGEQQPYDRSEPVA